MANLPFLLSFLWLHVHLVAHLRLHSTYFFIDMSSPCLLLRFHEFVSLQSKQKNHFAYLKLTTQFSCSFAATVFQYWWSFSSFGKTLKAFYQSCPFFLSTSTAKVNMNVMNTSGFLPLFLNLFTYGYWFTVLESETNWVIGKETEK